MPKNAKSRRAHAEIHAYAAAFPESSTHHPWGHVAVKVKNKIFVTLNGPEDEGVSMSVKLPISGLAALELPFTEPTHYGMGKHGWVSAWFEEGHDVPVGLLTQWIDESYRAVAPKRVVDAFLAAGGEVNPGAKPKAAAKKKTKVAKKKTAAAPKKTTAAKKKTASAPKRAKVAAKRKKKQTR